MADTTGEADLRKEYVDGAIKAIAQMKYVLKTLCTVDSSDSWTESYYRETNTDLTGKTSGGGAANTVKGLPRFAAFPSADASWTKVSGLNDKYGLEATLSYEDIKMNNIPMIARTMEKVAQAVSSAVDAQIASVLNASYGNTYAITAGDEWDSATVANRDPIFHILKAMQTMRTDNIDPLDGNGYLCLNGTDYTNLISNSKVMNNPSFKTADVVSNGVVGQICGLKIKVTEALEMTTPDVAYIVMDKTAMTWKQVTPLTVIQKEEPGISLTVRAFELGQCQMVVPNAVCKITNTRK
jgi:hypothetical protein